MLDWIQNKLKKLLALPETKEYINNNNFKQIYEDSEEAMVDGNVVGALTTIFIDSGLDPLRLDGKLTYVPAKYLFGQDWLEYYAIPKQVKAIHIRAFWGCDNLKIIEFEPYSNLNVILDEAFKDCINLKYIRIPEGTTHLMLRVFEGCSSLKYVYLPKSLIVIEGNCFLNTHLDEIEYGGTVEDFKKNLYKFLSQGDYEIERIKCVDGIIEL